MHVLNRAEVAKLAYRFWEERGRPLGSPEVDWCRAERELYALQEATPMLSTRNVVYGEGTGPWRAPDCTPG